MVGIAFAARGQLDPGAVSAVVLAKADLENKH